jgi:hypothetical protein
MLSPYIHAALAHERHQEFLAQAETDRRARQARLHRLRDGAGAARRSPRHWRPAWLRPGPSRLFSHWPRSAMTDWPVLTPKKELSPAELRSFTDVDHETLGALDHPGGRGVGVARHIRDADDPQAAEIAVTVIDDRQGRGPGTELAAQLCQ